MTKRRVSVFLILVLLGVGAVVLVVLVKKALTPPLAEISKPTNSPRHEIIGRSVENRPIEAYTYGQGPTRLLFVGGMHGGYEWNSVFLAYQFMDYLTVNPGLIPKNLTIIVIPAINPDGVYHVTEKDGRFALTDVSTDQQILEAGRFNARQVDLNRNFDCKWKPESTWRKVTVSAGSKAFSEPETIALRDFVLKQKPAIAVFWHSQANAVYASECEAGILPTTLKMIDVYTQASGYEAIKSFNHYDITGAAEDWLASLNIPAMTVELSTHTSIDWEKNLAGLRALFDYFGQETKGQ